MKSFLLQEIHSIIVYIGSVRINRCSDTYGKFIRPIIPLLLSISSKRYSYRLFSPSLWERRWKTPQLRLLKCHYSNHFLWPVCWCNLRLCGHICMYYVDNIREISNSAVKTWLTSMITHKVKNNMITLSGFWAWNWHPLCRSISWTALQRHLYLS